MRIRLAMQTSKIDACLIAAVVTIASAPVSLQMVSQFYGILLHHTVPGADDWNFPSVWPRGQPRPKSFPIVQSRRGRAVRMCPSIVYKSLLSDPLVTT